MQKILNILFLIIIQKFTYAQMFEGIIMSDTNQPIAFANVIAEKINTNELITGTISDEFGKFSLEINSNTPFNISIT